MAISLWHFGFRIGGGMEIPENWSEERIAQFEREMEQTVVNAIYVTVGVAAAIVFGSMAYYWWEENSE